VPLSRWFLSTPQAWMSWPLAFPISGFSDTWREIVVGITASWPS
jgi:hypothetical protein